MPIPIAAGLIMGGASLIGSIWGANKDQENAEKARAENNAFTASQNLLNRGYSQEDQMFNAQLGMAQFGAQASNQAGMFNAGQSNQLMQNMWSAKYGVASQQAKYDAFQAEFGDIKENVNNYFRTLSSSSVKAQNIDDINARMEGVDARLTQTMAERGIASSSGIAIQALAQSTMAGEIEKVKVNRNVDTELAGAKSQFLSAQANDPLLARAPDFGEGILNASEKDKMLTTYSPVTSYALPSQGGAGVGVAGSGTTSNTNGDFNAVPGIFSGIRSIVHEG